MQKKYYQQFKQTKEELILKYAGLVKRLANRLSARLPANFSVDDLYQVGMIGLINAIDRYDLRKETKLSTYATIKIRGAMLDELRANDWIPRSVRDKSNQLERAYQKLRIEGDDFPPDHKLAKALNIPLNNLPKFLEECRPIALISTEDLSRGSDDDYFDFYERFENKKEEGPAKNLLYKEKVIFLKSSINQLPEREKLVISLYYQEDLNLKEIGAVLKITESRVSQLRTKAIAMIRSYMKEYFKNKEKYVS